MKRLSETVTDALIVLLLVVAATIIAYVLLTFRPLYELGAAAVGIFFLLATLNNALAYVWPRWPRLDPRDVFSALWFF